MAWICSCYLVAFHLSTHSVHMILNAMLGEGGSQADSLFLESLRTKS